MDRYQKNATMEAKLKEAGLPFETVKVFGVARVNVHVTCVSVNTANKWVSMLTRVLGKAPSVTETVWRAAENKGTCLLPTRRHGFLVAVSA